MIAETWNVVAGISSRWNTIDRDWKCVLLGGAIVATVSLFNVSIPW